MSTSSEGAQEPAVSEVAPLDLVETRDIGFHFLDFLGREAKADGIESLTAQPYTVHSTINATLQRGTEAALQEGLAHYEIENGRVQFHGAEANIADPLRTTPTPGRDANAGDRLLSFVLARSTYATRTFGLSRTLPLKAAETDARIAPL
jgi:hypothetical protein